jgi:hypothetical protein
MEAFAGSNKTSGLHLYHPDALHVSGNRVAGNRALSRCRKILNPDFSPLTEYPSRHHSIAEFIFKLIRNVLNDDAVSS